MEEVRITAVVARVLRAFLDDPSTPQYGMELMLSTGLPSGTVYPVLARLERAGWLISAKEDIDPAVEGRPARRYFELHPRAIELARSEVAQLAQQLSFPAVPPHGRRRPGLAGGVT